MNIIGSVFYDHYRLGYARQLLWLDYFLLFWIGVDAIFYARAGLSLRAPTLWEVAPKQIFDSSSSLLLFLGFLLVVAPLMIAFLRVIGWTTVFLKGRLAKSHGRVLLTHTLICTLFIYLFIVTRNMQNLSGWQQTETPDLYQNAFHSIFYSLIASPSFKVLMVAIGTLVAGAGSAAITFILVGSGPTSAFKQYLVRASLADLPAPLRPTRSFGKFDIVPLSSLVRIQAVTDFSDNVLSRYQKSSPGTQRATRYLDSQFDECQDLIREKLITRGSGTASSPTAVDLDLFTETTQALQAALARIARPDLILVLPFASPSLSNFIRWHALLTGTPVKVIEFPSQAHFESWESQETRILVEVISCMRSGAKRCVFIASEVFYANGLRMPIDALLNRLRSKLGDILFRVIVDGTNAVGNRGLIDMRGSWDFYVFSPHRWLMASERCGVLVSRQSNNNALTAPGLWQIGARKSDPEVRIIAGLRGAMELLREPGLDYFTARCEKLRQEFKLNLPKGIRVVGDQSDLEETFILSCCPVPGSSWKFNPIELEDALTSRSLKASVLKLDPSCTWIRVSVPYYLDARELDRLCNFLEDVTR